MNFLLVMKDKTHISFVTFAQEFHSSSYWRQQLSAIQWLIRLF